MYRECIFTYQKQAYSISPTKLSAVISININEKSCFVNNSRTFKSKVECITGSVQILTIGQLKTCV